VNPAPALKRGALGAPRIYSIHPRDESRGFLRGGVKVKYANTKTEQKSIYGVVTIEIKGRTGNFDVLAETEGSQPLIGQVVLEILDLVVDPRTRTLVPNPQSPEMPMVEILGEG
jgi:hypothetical protein